MTVTDIAAFIWLWHQGLYLHVEESCVILRKWQMLHIGVCCCFFLQGPNEIEITEQKFRTLGRVVSNLPAILLFADTWQLNFSMLGCMTWCHSGTTAWISVMTTRRSDAYYLLLICNVCIKGRKELLWSKLLPYFVNFSLSVQNIFILECNALVQMHNEKFSLAESWPWSYT
jgi:hypothetical protein